MRASSSKQGADNNHSVRGHLLTLHQRLQHALGLGSGYHEGAGRKWNFTDFDKQRLAIRSIDSYLDFLSSEMLKHHFVKDSIPNMFDALGSILESKSESVLILASAVAVKIVCDLPSFMVASHAPDLVLPLSSLLFYHQSQVSLSSATALNVILSNLSSKRENEVWDIFKQRNLIAEILQILKGFSTGDISNERFEKMASLLSKILQKWPPSRLYVYTDTKLLDLLDTLTVSPKASMQSSLLQIYSAIALCRNGAMKVLENGDSLLKMMVDNMDLSKPDSIQMEAFNLAQCLMMSEQECSTVIKICGEPVVEAILAGMARMRKLYPSLKEQKKQMPILVKTCSLALITRWAGEHHHYFWKAGICEVLLRLFMDNFNKDYHSFQSLPLREKIGIIQSNEALQTNFCLPLRPYVWDILGHLATNSDEGCNPVMHGHEACLKTLVLCACLGFVDSMSVTYQTSEDSCAHEPVSRAVLMMVFSPWKYLAKQTRYILSEVLASNLKHNVNHLLNILRTRSSGNEVVMPSNLQVLISLTSLTCYSGLRGYKKHIIKDKGVKTLLTFISWWVLNPLHVRRSHLSPHTHDPFRVRACCWGHSADWEGEEMLLLLGLWCLAELVGQSGSYVALPKYLKGANGAQFVEELQHICCESSSPGSRWYAAYILRCFGLWGFPNKFGQRIRKALDNKDLMPDLELTHWCHSSFHVHGVILSVRCPSLLPSKQLATEKPHFGSFSKWDVETCERSMKKVRLSAHADHQILTKLLEYVYSGYFQSGKDLFKKLKSYANYCNLDPLQKLLDGIRPKWGDTLPKFDLTRALGRDGYEFSDIILEANAPNLTGWRCSVCCSLAPHYHLHKVILCSSCNYFHSLFRSGMQESHLQTLKVSMSWETLVKLVNWFYSGELTRPISGCVWDSLDFEKKLEEVRPYVELYWLADYWLIDGDLREDCYSAIVSSLDSCRELSTKIMQIAADLSEQKLVKVAVEYAAPSYHLIRNSGELDALDGDLVEMIRAASVRLFQEKS
ncbi:unnamed protein product [Cuscuta epithymum]|uniref:BTB domain-containing protein n=1 Tax=Cuscuta epithymum TaxID=186058 RepID=A0AAV0GBK4_9ASTE|nr:unnamed protein product [Cuscuta epithymum]